jgi:hypothetical protein
VDSDSHRAKICDLAYCVHFFLVDSDSHRAKIFNFVYCVHFFLVDSDSHRAKIWDLGLLCALFQAEDLTCPGQHTSAGPLPLSQ